MSPIAQRLFELLCQQNYQNILISPLGLEIAFTFLLKAAEGESKEQIKRLLLEADVTEKDQLDKVCSLAELSETLSSHQTAFKFENQLLTSPRTPLKKEREEELQQLMELVVKTMENPTSLSVFHFQNDLFFKAKWYHHFDEHPLLTDLFTLANGEQYEQAFMVKDHDFMDAETEYVKAEGFHAVRLWFEGKRTCMEIYLPFTPDSLPTLLEQVKSETLQNWQSQFKKTPFIHLMLPKFELNCEWELHQLKNELGISDLFKESYDYHNTFHHPDDVPIVLEKIIQTTHIHVEEEGVTASATTIVTGGTGSNRVLENEELVVFNATHPFFYLIRDVETDTTFFMGTYDGVDSRNEAFLMRQKEEAYQEIVTSLKSLSYTEKLMALLYGLHQASCIEKFNSPFLDWFFNAAIEYLEKFKSVLIEGNYAKLSADLQEEYQTMWEERGRFFHSISLDLFCVNSKYYNENDNNRKWQLKGYLPEMKRLSGNKKYVETYYLVQSILHCFSGNSTFEYVMDDDILACLESLKRLFNADQLVISAETITALQQYTTSDWSNVIEVVKLWEVPNYATEYTIDPTRIQQRNAYQELRTAKTFLPHITYRARVVLVAWLYQTLASKSLKKTVASQLIEECFGQISTNSSEQIVKQHIDKLDHLAAYITVGEYMEDVEKVLSVAIQQEFKQIISESNQVEYELFSRVLSGCQSLEEFPDKLYLLYPLYEQLQACIQKGITIPDLSSFKDFMIEDGDTLGKPIPLSFIDGVLG